MENDPIPYRLPGLEEDPTVITNGSDIANVPPRPEACCSVLP
jgi:hypothetical protein